MEYIITFYSHFGAISYKRKCAEKGIAAKLMPVPRSLSSSCGTCVCCTGDVIIPNDESNEADFDELEAVFRVETDGYSELYSRE